MHTVKMFRVPGLTDNSFEIKVPASIANLGPGFDTLAVAVQLYLRLRVRRIPGRGRLEFLFVDHERCRDNRIERAFRMLAGENADTLPSLLVEVSSDIPMRAGLGSSAAATVAGLRLYDAVAGPVSQETMLTAACAIESHPDNAAAALLGGLTISCQLPDGAVHATCMEWPESLAFVVLTPEVPLTTQDSRAVLPDCLPRKDVVFNLQRVALLLRSLQSEDFSLMKLAMSDRVHQPARVKVVPGLAQALQLEHDDLLGVCLSGSGPSIAAMAESNLPEVGRLLASVYDPLGIDYQVRTLRVHRAASQQPAKLFRSGLLCS